MTDLENREAFEKWAADETGMNLDRDMTDQYVSITTFMSWESWQASIKRQGFKLVSNSFIADIHDMALDGKYFKETCQTQDKFEEIQEYCKEIMINAV